MSTSHHARISIRRTGGLSSSHATRAAGCFPHWERRFRLHILLVSAESRKLSDIAEHQRWLHIILWGMFKLMNFVKEKYGNPPVIITEIGMDDAHSPFSRIENVLQDDKRIQYHSDYMSNLLDAIRKLCNLNYCWKEGCNVHGYFVWSLLDNWEWNSASTVRFSLYYIDFENNLTKIPKASVEWFSQVLAQKTAIM